MIGDYFDLSNLTVVKDDFISFNLPLQEQTDNLYEDMFQAYFNVENTTVLDIGWYGETEELNGTFILYLIKDNDWESPILKISTKDLDILKYFIQCTLHLPSKF